MAKQQTPKRTLKELNWLEIFSVHSQLYSNKTLCFCNNMRKYEKKLHFAQFE